MTNFKIVGAIRNEIAYGLDIDFFQEFLTSRRKPCFDNLHVCMTMSHVMKVTYVFLRI